MTKRPTVFSIDTRLWHPTEGWKLFPQGEQDPGPAWHNQEGGDPISSVTTAQTLKDMIAFQEQIELKDRLLVSKDHDLCVMANERDDAVGKLKAAEQRARDAEFAKQDAEDVAAQVTAERDQARQTLTIMEEKIKELERTNDAMKESVKTFDHDGDGRPGGSVQRKNKLAAAAKE